jgi:hypothetical protein
VLRIHARRLPLAVGARGERYLGLKASPYGKGDYSIKHLSGFLYNNYLLYYFSISVRAARSGGDGYVMESIKRGALDKFRTLGLIEL